VQIKTYGKVWIEAVVKRKGEQRKIARVLEVSLETVQYHLRDKIAYLVKKTKAHAKSPKWLD